MIYLTKNDILGRIKASNLEVITGGDDDLLNDSELDAISVVVSYLAHDYDTDLVFQPIDTEGYVMNATVKRMTVDIMIYNLHNGSINPRQIPENIVAKRDDAIRWLSSVANPKTMVNAPFLQKKAFEGNSNNAMAWGSKTKRQNEY